MTIVATVGQSGKSSNQTYVFFTIITKQEMSNIDYSKIKFNLLIEWYIFFQDVIDPSL